MQSRSKIWFLVICSHRKKAYVVNAPNTVNPGTSATPQQIITAAQALTGARNTSPDNGSIVFNKGFQNEVYLVTGTGSSDAVQAIDKAVNATSTFIRNRLTQLLCVTPDNILNSLQVLIILL